MFTKDKKRESPEIPTAALPDIIFILLFFFVITVTPQEEPRLVDATTPTEERVKSFDVENVLNFFVGPPSNSTLGSQPVIQFMNQIVPVNSIPLAIENYRQNELDASKKNMKLTVILTCDVNVPAGFVADLKEQLIIAGIQDVINKVEVPVN